MSAAVTSRPTPCIPLQGNRTIGNLMHLMGYDQGLKASIMRPRIIVSRGGRHASVSLRFNACVGTSVWTLDQGGRVKSRYFASSDNSSRTLFAKSFAGSWISVRSFMS